MKDATRPVIIAAALLLALSVSDAAAQRNSFEEATFAGGCFWCMEKPFDVLDGVHSTTSGFAGGHVANPSYDQVTAGGTGHYEVVNVVYDPTVVSYEELLYVYWRNVDPFDGDGQFCDRGQSYAPAILYRNEVQRELAELSATSVERKLGTAVAVAIESVDVFYAAEAYHQNYYRERPIRYSYYRTACGRDRRLDAVWGDEARGEDPGPWLSSMNGSDVWRARADRVGELIRGIRVDGKPYVVTASRYDAEARVVHEPDAEIDYPVELSTSEWQTRLTPDQFYVLRQDGTEPAFRNPLYDTKERGIYYSAATGQPLFHSDDKYESGTGWPSFTRPISPDAVAYVWDRGLFSRRVEVVDSLSGSHIGHVFDDGPGPHGRRYCMNSAALIFVPEGGDPPEMLGGDPIRSVGR